MRSWPIRRDAAGLRFAVVVSRFNHLLCARLLEGCVGELVTRGAEPGAIDVAWVPGAYEIPQAARNAKGRTLAGESREPPPPPSRRGFQPCMSNISRGISISRGPSVHSRKHRIVLSP